MVAFEKYIKKKDGRGRPSKYQALKDMEVGQFCVYENTNKKDMYDAVYFQERKYGTKFEYQECVNGIIVKRTK